MGVDTKENAILKRMNQRASCRNFLDKEIPDDVLHRILDCAVKSPSTSGFQDYSLIVVKDKEKLKLLGRYSMNQRFIEKAPAAIVFCIDLQREKMIVEGRPSPWNEDRNFINLLTKTMDTAIAAQTLCLAAEEEGVRSVFIANILNSLEEVSFLLELPDYVIPSLMVVLGYGKGEHSISGKYDRSVLVHNEQYQMINKEELFLQFDKKYRDWKVRPTEKMMERITDAAKEYQGQEYADRCRKEIVDTGIVNPHQFYYGYWYRGNGSGLDLESYTKFLQDKKFFWLNRQKEK